MRTIAFSRPLKFLFPLLCEPFVFSPPRTAFPCVLILLALSSNMIYNRADRCII
jgi:hypothetical protein